MCYQRFTIKKVPCTLPVVRMSIARVSHELPAATTDVIVLPGVLGCRPLRRTVEVRLGTNPAVPWDGCPVARPSSRSRDSNS
ncbi:MAG: hypothetical protein WBF55_11080 [Syntrophobacteria bacterium]